MNEEQSLQTVGPWRKIRWILPLFPALVVGAYIYFGMPHEREIRSLWTLLFKLTPFFLAGFSVAWFPQKASPLLKAVLVFATLLPFLGFLVPRLLHLTIAGYEMGYDMAPSSDIAPLLETFGQYYTMVAILVPYVILMIAFAYRCGGGGSANCLKIAWTGLLLMLSGYEDIMFWLVNARGPFPEVATWASHVTVFLGRPATRAEFYVFIGVHLVLIAVVFALPLDRIGAGLEQRGQRWLTRKTDPA
jgi:hypothetical protein